MSNPGFRVFKKVDRPDPSLVQAFAGYPTATIGDVMNRLACMASAIAPLNKAPLLGPAVTVRARPGDNLMFHHAIDLARPGDVIVVDGRSDLSTALAGENMVLWARKRGIGGFVIDGAMRDIEAIAQLDFPVFCAGSQPNGPFKMGPGEVNVPVHCGGVAVCPGDLIIGDADGVCVVPKSQLADVLAKAAKKKEYEDRSKAEIEAGIWDRKAYLEASLKGMGCEFIDDVYARPV